MKRSRIPQSSWFQTTPKGIFTPNIAQNLNPAHRSAASSSACSSDKSWPPRQAVAAHIANITGDTRWK